MKLHKIAGLLSNAASVVLVGPFSLYFGALGLVMLASATGSITWSVVDVLGCLSCVLFLCTPLLLIVGILLSVLFRKKNQYKNSYLIQLLPFASAIAGIFLFVVSMIWGNP